MAEAFDDLPYGQKRLLRLFSGSNHDVVFVPHDPFDMRICGALTHRGLLRPATADGYRGFELTDDGRAALGIPA